MSNLANISAEKKSLSEYFLLERHETTELMYTIQKFDSGMDRQNTETLDKDVKIIRAKCIYISPSLLLSFCCRGVCYYELLVMCQRKFNKFTSP